jgi:hypothetical protein
MELVNLGPDQWQELVAISPQGTIFHETCYLESLGLHCDYFGISKKGNLLGGIALPKSESCTLMPYQAYNGFIFHPDLCLKKIVSRVEQKFQISEFLANELLNRYKDIRLSCIDYDEDLDLRGFLWTNYHDKSLPSYNAQISYTSILDTTFPLDQSEFRKGRSSSFNKSKKFQFTTEVTNDVEAMEKIYLETFERQEIELPDSTIKLASNLFRRLNKDGKAILIGTSCDGELASMSMFGIDNKRSYYLFSANNTAFRNKEAGTANMVWAIEHLKRALNINKLEMIGVNSPQRGSYKLSFGGSLKAYYQISKIDKR